MSALLLPTGSCVGGVTGELSPPPLHNISHLDITHLYLLAWLAPLVVVVDGEHPQTPGVVLVRVLPDASLPTGRITVCSYHRLGRVGRLEIIGHRPVMMIYVVMEWLVTNNHLVTWFMWSASCLSPPLTLCLLTLCLASLRQQVLNSHSQSQVKNCINDQLYLNTRPTIIMIMREMTTMRVSLYIK